MPDIRVRIAAHAVAKGDGTLSTVGLGSCVAIGLFDVAYGVGALAHVLLPDPAMSRDRSNRAKFAETAVPLLLEAMHAFGARGEIVAKIAGGSSMFQSLLPSNGTPIGDRNVSATRRALADAGIRIVGEDTGGDHGRTVHLHLRGGRMTVRSLLHGERVL